MKQLNETLLADAMSKIKEGDTFVVKTDKDLFFKVAGVSGEELMFNDKNNKYILRKNGFENGVLSYWKKGVKGFTQRGSIPNVRFLRIERAGKVIDRITDIDVNKTHTSNANQGANIVKKQNERKFEFISSIQGLTVGDMLTIRTGRLTDDERYDEDTINVLKFVVMGYPTKHTYMLEFISCEGPKRDVYGVLENKELLTINPKSPIITDDGVMIIKLFGDGKIYKIRNVVNLEKEKVDNSRVITKDDIMNNKYFRDAMIKNASWLERLFGNNIPKGIIPAKDTISGKSKENSTSSELDKRIQKKNKLLFRLISDEVSINGIKFSNDINYIGRVKEDFTLKIYLSEKNNKIYAKITFLNASKFREDTYNVKIDLIQDAKGFNATTKTHRGQIKVLSYNHQ